MKRLKWILPVYMSVVFGFLPMLNSVVQAEGTSYGGYVAAEARWFIESAQHTGQSNDDSYSYVLRPELRYELDQHRFTLVPFYRYDNIDDERTHFDLREAHWRWSQGDQEVLIGVNHVFWGVMESRHLVDIINQTDLVEDPDGEDKLGQPMLQYVLLKEWGTLDFYILPGFRERRFPGVEGRLRTALPVDWSLAQYESSDEDDHVDLALRYSHVLGDWDIGLGYFNGTSREPRFVLNNTATRLLPVYDLINQASLDLQLTDEAWLWKAEAIWREGQGNSFAAVSAGFEYSFYQLIGSSKDLGVILEYHYDGRDGTAAPTFYDYDIFIGTRLAFNDSEDTEILAGVSVDNSGDDRFFNLEAETRVAESIKVELRMRLFDKPEQGGAVEAIERDDYIQLQARYYL